jgi:hypothetical protein
MTLDELTGKNFASTTEVAQLWDGADPRTVRRMAEREEIPSIRIGNRIMIPVAWLRRHLEGGSAPAATESSAGPDPDQFADRVADRIAGRLARAFAALASSDMDTAGPASPGPAATPDDLTPTKEQSHAHRMPAA